MKNILGAVIFAAAIGFSGTAHASFIEATYGNTVTVATAEGNVVQSYYFDEDGGFSLSGADGATATGTWEMQGEEICVTVGDDVSCNPTPDVGVGESWDLTTDDGNVLTISIVAGR